MADLERDVSAYAQLCVLLSRATHSEERASVLAAHGLNEDQWERLDEAWQTRLSDCDIGDDREGQAIPPLLANFAQAFTAAQQTTLPTETVLSLDVYLDIAKGLKQGKSTTSILSQYQTTLEEFLNAHRHWTQQAIHNPEIAHRMSREFL